MQYIIEEFNMNEVAKPFLKWAGGKQQLVDRILKRFPDNINKSKHIKKYVEPFIGGGALFFYLKSHFEVEESIICDINPELIIGYKVIQKDNKRPKSTMAGWTAVLLIVFQILLQQIYSSRTFIKKLASLLNISQLLLNILTIVIIQILRLKIIIPIPR